jgi:lipopolysaccharide/colanic/teichoic acid biosynthesis glycosyltransferase
MPVLTQPPAFKITPSRGVAQPVRRVDGRKRRSVARFHVVDEALFTHALAREQRRAERFEESFVLVRITLPERLNEPRRAQLLDALAVSARETDIIGWCEQDAVLGLIRGHVGQEPLDGSVSLASVVQQEWSAALAAGTLAGCSIRLDVYSPMVDSTPARIERPHRRSRLGDLATRAAKRLLDIAGSAALLAVLSPVFLVIAALIKWTSKGPVFFRQERVGRHAKTFTMLKFRTMRVDAGHELHQQYVSQFIQNGHAKAAAANTADDNSADANTATATTAPSQTPSSPPPVFKIVNDPRVTPLGHFLRRSSLDELPQFWNVLIGEMSLVGPRPPLPYEVKVYKRWHRRRLFVAKPGITGLWQVTGRSRTTFDEMVRLDIRYAKNPSVWTDVKILLATPRAVISGNGAH